MKKPNKKISDIGGWLLVLLAVFILSALNYTTLLVQKISAILAGKAQFGVYISAILLLIYSILLICSIILIVNKKRKAICLAIVSLVVGFIFIVWYTILGPVLYYNNKGLATGIILAIANLILSVIIISYFKKSKRVKATLVK